jgi:hypothetical protein
MVSERVEKGWQKYAFDTTIGFQWAYDFLRLRGLVRGVIDEE